VEYIKHVNGTYFLHQQQQKKGKTGIYELYKKEHTGMQHAA